MDVRLAEAAPTGVERQPSADLQRAPSVKAAPSPRAQKP